MRPGFWFCARFALRDLCDLRAALSTVSTISTVAIVCGLTMLAFALPDAAHRAQDEKLAQEPHALALWAWDTDGDLGAPITPERFARTKAGLDLSLGSRLRDVRPFHESTLKWERRAEPGEQPGQRRFWGRSVDWVNDPFAEALKVPSSYLSGGPFAMADQPGIILTRRMLSILGYPEDTAIGTRLVHITKSAETRVEVPLVGVLRDPLPLGHSFILTAPYEIALLSTEPDVMLKEISYGPVPKDWPRDFASLPTLAQEVLKENDITFSVTYPKGQPTWVLRSFRDIHPRLSEWNSRVGQLRDRLTSRGFPAPASAKIEYAAPPRKELFRPGHDKIGVFVYDVRALGPAANSIREAGLQSNEGVIPQMTAFNEATESAAAVLRKLLWAVWCMAGVALLALSILRVRPKVREIGMLRASGASSFTLASIFLLETLYIGFIGVTFGLGIAVIIWQSVAADNSFQQIATPALMANSAWFLGGVLACIGLGTAIGTCGPMFRQPARPLLG